MNSSPHQPCVCGSGRDYATCCGIFHAGEPAPSAEALMRSRYSAYVLGIEAYLLATWHPDTRPERVELDIEPRPSWLGLKVTQVRLLSPDSAIVEFVARYKLQGRAHRLHEISRFSRREGRWFYLEGEFPAGT